MKSAEDGIQDARPGRVRRVPDEEEIEALYEAGCDDAVIVGGGGYATAEFDREADSLAEAIVSAVQDVERSGFRAVRVLDDNLVSLADIASRIGKSREIVRLYSVGARGPGDFPPPVNPHGDVRFWRWSEVVPWLRAYGIEIPEVDATLAAANLALQFRVLSKSAETSPLRALVA